MIVKMFRYNKLIYGKVPLESIRGSIYTWFIEIYTPYKNKNNNIDNDEQSHSKG